MEIVGIMGQSLILPLHEIVPQVGSSTPPPLSIRLMGKSLVSISFFALVTFGVAARAVWHATRGEAADRAQARSTMNTSLFWGAFTFAVALIHTLIGLVITALSVRAAAPIEPGIHWLIATGIAVPLASSVYGLFVLLLAALVWLGFRTWHARAKRLPA